jgi:hypothetical protein
MALSLARRCLGPCVPGGRRRAGERLGEGPVGGQVGGEHGGVDDGAVGALAEGRCHGVGGVAKWGAAERPERCPVLAVEPEVVPGHDPAHVGGAGVGDGGAEVTAGAHDRSGAVGADHQVRAQGVRAILDGAVGVGGGDLVAEAKLDRRRCVGGGRPTGSGLTGLNDTGALTGSYTPAAESTALSTDVGYLERSRSEHGIREFCDESRELGSFRRVERALVLGRDELVGDLLGPYVPILEVVAVR